MSYEPPMAGGYAAGPAKTSPKAITALVLGILGIIPCASCLVFGIVAIVLGRSAQNDISSSGSTS